MNKLIGKAARALVVAAGTLLIGTSLWAQTAAGYPARPVRLLIPFPPGGYSDVAGRYLAQALSQVWGQPVVVDNKPGAAGILASDLAAKAAPDGYTLYFVHDGPMVINPFIYKTLSYDPVKDFVPVALVTSTTMVLVANPEKVGARTLKDFVAGARSTASRPMDYSSGGAGGPHHLFMENFKGMAGLNFNHIPYKGGAPALQAVLAGEVSTAFAGIAPSVAQAKAGKLTVLGSGGAKRSLLAPDIPTIAEQGYPGFEATAWVGLVAPKGTPQAIVDKIEADVLKIARDPPFVQKILAAGGDPLPGTAAEFRELIRKDQQRYSKLIRDLDIKAD